MKRKWLWLAVAVLLSGCAKTPQTTEPTGGNAPSFVTTGATVTEPAEQETEAPKTAQTQVLYCRFRQQITPADYEAYVGYFPSKEGEVYVDLAMRVRNTCNRPIDRKDILGSFSYGSQSYTMQFEVEENAGDFANETKQVPPGESRIVHLFYTVDGAAERESITVKYSVLGQENQISVAKRTEPAKRRLSPGDSLRQEGQYALEVLSCQVASSFGATGANAQGYYVEGSQVLSLAVKVRNLGSSPLGFLEGYLLAEDHPEFANVQMEINEKTELEDWDEPILPGKERVLLLWVAIPEGTPTGNMSMRFNIEGDSFLCDAT